MHVQPGISVGDLCDATDAAYLCEVHDVYGTQYHLHVQQVCWAFLYSTIFLQLCLLRTLLTFCRVMVDAAFHGSPMLLICEVSWNQLRALCWKRFMYFLPKRVSWASLFLRALSPLLSLKCALQIKPEIYVHKLYSKLEPDLAPSC